MTASSEADVFCWTCLSPSEVMELQKCQQGLNLDTMRLHIMKSVWPPPLVVVRQKRNRTQQGVGRAARKRKRCVNVKHLLQNVGRDQEHEVPGGMSWHLLFRERRVLHQRLFLYASQHALLYLRRWVKIDPQALWYPCSDVKMSLHVLENKPCLITKIVVVLTAEQCLSWGAFQDNLIASCPSISMLVLVLLIL